MNNELTKSIKAALYDRTVSPLFGAFLISWLAWNHRFVVVLLSSMDVAEKFSYIDENIYGTWWPLVGNAFLLPLLTALFFIFAYPYPAKYVYEFWRHRQKELKLIRQKIEDETPLTMAESRVLREKLADVSFDYEQKLNRANDELEGAKRAISEVELREEALRKELDKAIKEKGIRSTPVHDNNLEGILINESFRLFYNPQKGKEASKILKFESGGRISEGNNSNEDSWRLQNGILEILQTDRRVHSRFAYLPESKIFVSTNDADTRSSLGQYILTEK